MSDDLIAFLKAWHDWATNGAPQGTPFFRGWGLCSQTHGNTRRELKKLLCAQFGDVMAPFGRADYTSRRIARTQHECPKRLAWVRERLIEAGELVA